MLRFDWTKWLKEILNFEVLVICICRVIQHIIVALFNPLDTFGDRYGSVNVLLGRLSTGKLCFTFSSPDPTPSSSYDHIQVSIVLEIILLFKLSSLDIKAKVHDLSVYLEFDDSLRESEIPHVDNSAKPITDTPNIYQIMLTRFLNYLCLLKIDILSMKMNINGLATLQVSNVEGSMHFQDMTEQHTLSLGELSLVYSTPQLTSPSRTDSTFLSVDNLQYIREKASTKLLYGSVCLNVAIHEKPELLCMIQRLLSLAILFSQYSPTFYSSRLRQHQAELYDRLGQCNKQQASGSIEYDEEEGLFYYDLNASVSSSDSITFPDSEMTEAPNLNLAGKQLCVLCSYSDTEGLYETFEVHNVSLDVQSNTSTLMIGCVKTNHRSDTSGGVSYVGENVFVLTASKQGNDKQLLKAQLNPLQLRISTKALSNFFTLHSILSPFLVCLDKFAAMLSIQEQLDVDLPAHTVGARNTHQFSYCFQAAQLSLALYDNSNQSDVSLSVQTASLVPSEGKAAGHSLRVETFRVDCQAQPVLTVANIFAMHEQASEHSVKESVKIESVDLHVTLACVSSISKILSGIRPRTLGGVADSKYTSVWKAIHIDVTSHVSRIVIVQKTQVRCTYLSGQDFRNKHTGDTLYELCVPEAVELEQKVLGNWVEDTKIVLHDKISLSCSKVDSFTSEVLKTKMLLQITAKKNLETHREGEGGCQPGVYRKPCVTIRIVNAWGECFHTRRLAIGYHLSTLGLDVGNCSLLCDVQDLQPMLRIINEYNLLSYEHPVYTEPRRYCHPRVDTILQSPSSIFKLQINKVHVTLEHLYKPVVFLTLQEACLYNTSFSDYIFQHSMSLCNMVLSELSADYAIHKTVLSSVDGGGNQQNTVSAHYTLVNEYTAHASDFMYSGGVYEIVIESLRFIYLQRATLTLVCYIRDYLIKDIYDTLYQEFPSSQGVDTTARYKGIFRLGIRVANSEVHLPNSSCAMEALVIFFKSLDVYRLNDVYSQSNSLVKYCQGPLISQDIFLSDYANCDIFFHRMVTYAEMLFEKPVYFHSLQQIVLNDAYYWEINNANVIENIVESQIGWNVLKYANDLARKADPKLPVYLTNQSYLMIELHDAMIASYCNNNPICEHQEISCKYHIYQVTPYDASQHTNGQIHNFIDNENDKDNLRNTMIVYVEAKEVDWVLSQGQYWAIVNLIQQNFCELQEHVEDPWVLPEPKCVDINEDLYGKFVLSKYLPIINSVPIVISKGKITTIFNESLYYSRFVLPAPAPPLFDVDQAHNIHYEMPDTIPSVDHIIDMRQHCHHSWKANHDVYHVFQDEGVTNEPYAPSEGEEEVDSTPFCVLFEDLYVDFFRKHFGGGNGIEVYANSFIVLGIDDNCINAVADSASRSNTSSSASILPINELHSYNTRNLKVVKQIFDEVNIRNVVFAPKDSYYFALSKDGQGNKANFPVSTGYYDALETPTTTNSGKIDGSPPFESKSMNLNEYQAFHLYPPQYPNDTYSYESQSNSLYSKRPPLHYSQQGVQNLRRCHVTVFNSVVVAHFHSIMSIVKFFNHPVRVAGDRNEAVLQEKYKEEFDYKAGLDVEVFCDHTVAFLPNFPAITNSTSSVSTKDVRSSKAFPQSPPISTIVHDCPGLGIQLNLAYTQAWRGFLQSGPGSERSLISARILNMFIAPLYECNVEDSISLVEQLQFDFFVDYFIYPMEEKFYTNAALCRSYIQFGDWISSKINKLEHPSGSRLMRVTMKKVINSENGDVVDGLHASYSRSSVSSMSNQNQQEDYDEDADKGIETDINGEVNHDIHSKFSLKDVDFIVAAITHLRASIRQQILSIPKRDPYCLISKHIEDMRAVPDLKYWLVCTSLDKGLHTDVKELSSTIDNFDVTLHNNTYNLNILNVNISEICLAYSRSLEHLHIASGVYAHINTYNDSLDVWEPVLEPLHVNAIGATDATTLAENKYIGLTTSKIRVEVTADRVECNASQYAITNLIHKLQLNDVVTSSSNRLPPYKIFNQLGVDIYFNIGYNGGVVINNVVSVDSSLPIEISQLVSALNNYKMRKLYHNTAGGGALSNISHSKEYLLWISFINFRDIYESRIPLSIDKVGTNIFDMMKANRNQHVQHHHQSLFAAEVSDETSSSRSSGQPIKFVSEVPLTLLHMSINNNGIRELYLRSILSIKNHTNRMMYVSVKFYGSSAETLLAPGKVYHVPVRYAHPKASLHLKFIDDGMYYEAMSSLGGFIAQGPWGNPLKLRAHLCLCPNDESRAVRAVGSSSSANNAAFMVMLKPEVKHGSILSQSKTHVPVKYPGKENYVKLAGASVSSNNNINCSSSGISSNAKVHITHNILALKPFIIHIQAPVLFCNLLPIPMLYKLASDSNILCAEGCLLPGQTIDVYNLSAMYNNRLYISIRVVNYAWSKWYILCTRSSPYHHTEKHSDITLKPLQFRPLGHHTTADGIPINLPTLDIAIIQKEYLVRFSCQIILNNASNISLYLSESAYPDNFLILQQNVAIGIGNDQQLAPASSTLVRLNSTGTGYSPNDVIAIQDNSDDEEDTSHSTEVTSHNAVSSNTPFMSSNTVNIHVYLPHDHVKCIEVQISSDCTVSQVFLAVKDQLSHSASIVNIQDYLLFYYQANKGMQNNVLADAIADTGDDEVGVVDSQSVAASTTSTPPRGLFRSRSGSRSSEKSSKSVDKTVDPSSVPPNMKYNMSIDLSNENNSISSNTYVYALLSYDIVIVHKAEHAIYTQSKNIVAETLTEGSTGIFNSMFGKSVKVQHLTSFVPYNSAIPYKPHRMLSFHAHVCVKDHITTDWSNTFDLVKTDYDVGDMTILVKSRHLPEQYKSIYSHNHNVFYELGTFVEKGRGLLQHSTMITFVPKRILISKLAYSIFIKQISNEAEFELVAGGISHFHFVDKTKFPLLHARKDQDGSYCGELDISRLGLVYVKLRLISGSICILKVETELIGASFISTFTEQSLIWPPYRIYNNTSLVIRYKQSLDAVISGGNTIASNLAATLSNVHSEEGHTMDVPLDTLKPKQSAGYAWDYPHTGSKLIKLEILPQNTSVNNPNSTSAHVAKDINVYNLYNSSTTETMVIKKTVPNIGNPLAEGHLLLQQGVDSFLKVYCILRTDILYVYEDDSRNILINIIHFSHTVDTSIRYAMVGKYQDSARPQLMGFLNNIIGGGSNTSKYLQNLQYYDVNNVRILMLTLANYMQLFSSLTLELLNKKFARKESESDTGSVNEEVVEAAPTLEEFKIDDAIVSSVTSVTNIFNHEATVLFERRSSADDGRDTVVQQESEINTPISVHLPKNLHSFLANGIGVEQLLDEISVKPILLHDIVTSLLDCNIVENEEEAHLLCECWIAHGFLVKASRIVSSEDISDSKDRNVDATAESDDVDEKALVDSARKESSEANESEDDEADEGFEDDVDDIKDKSDIAPSRERRQSLNYRKEVTKLLSDALKKRYLSAMSGKQNRPVTKTSRLIDEYLDEELFFRPPALCPELAAAMQQHDSKNSSEGADVTAEDDQFGFSLIVPGSKYNFRCASEMEYLGWLQACRQSVELAWKEIILGNKSISNLSVEDFQATVNIKVRADGSTKVIEIVENESSIKKVSQTRGKPHKRSSTSSLLMPLLNRGKRLLRQAGSANSAVEEWSVEAVDKDSELLAVSFSIKAVSLSVIDTAPQEILYLGLNDIHMTVVRYFDAVQFSVTVRNIQVSNQLLNPTFPVLLFARRLKETQSGKLMLPGLNTDLYSDTYTFPTLHLYLKQRYHSINPETGLPLVTDNDQNHQKLWYFDLFTLWLAPLQLAVDEEIIMRVIRYGWGIRNAVMKKTTNSKSLKETGGAVSLQSSKFLQTELDYRDISQYHKQFLQAATSSFESYAYRVKKALNLYFGLLQLHPLDVTLNFRPSPEVQISNAELAAMSIISQLDAARLCLNALIAENAFGSTTIISEIIIKHYRASFWRQFHKLIGATDIVEGSVGLVANIGTGFYDLFYEPIDGLLDSNSSFLNGLSKGGKSLASRAIGGTSAFTSTITGGIGKGVSLLTLDSDFQRNRSLRRFNKTTSVSEGLMVGTQELGKNIMEGVTGIVVAPYKGWESGGGVGLGVGIAKGILGVALKPAVGVFDLASRATEGIRNAAFSSTSDIIVEMKGTYRTRVPRAFGRSGVLLAYDAHAAAAQYMIDSLAGFKADPRMHVIGHLYLVRKVSEDLKNKYHDFSDKNRETSRRRDSNILAILDEEEVSKNVQESWGMSVEKQYLITVGSDRVVLMEILNYSSDDANAGITNTTPTSGNKKKKAVANYRRFVWSCPAQYIDQLYCDNRGDLVLTLSHSVHIASPWNASCPTVLDLQMQNYTLMQSLLEQTVGVKQARLQPLNPWTGFTQSNIRKRYNSGIRSYLLAPTYHTYRLFGSVLYEYSSVSSSKSAAPSGATQSTSVDQPNQPVMTTSSTDSEVVLNSAEFAEKLIRRLFDPVQAKRRDEKSNARRQALLAKIRAQRLAEEEKEAEEVDLAEADAIAIQEQQMRQSLEMALIDDSRSEVSVERVDSVELSEELSTSANDLVSQNDVEENVKALQSSLSAPHGLETIAESEQEDILDDGQVDLNASQMDILRQSVSGDDNSVSNLNVIRRVDKVDSDDEEEDEFENRQTMYSLEDNEDTDGMLLPQDLPEELLSQMQRRHRDSLSTTSPTLLPNLTPFAVQEEIPDNMFLSFIYPLVDLYISGPHIEDNGKQFTIMLARIDGQKMRVLRREDDHGLFIEYKKNSLSLLFDSMDNALRWRHAIEQRIILRAPDALPSGFLTTEERKKAGRSMLPIVGGKNADTSPVIENSILSSLVLPTSDVDPELAELIKIEIARTISETKR